MPYEILVDQTGASEKSGAPSSSDIHSRPQSGLLLHIRLTPHQSLSPQGFVTFVGITFVLMLVPLTALIGTKLWWGIAPFVLGSLAFLWAMLKRSWRDGTLQEDLRLWSDRIEITRQNPRAPTQTWEANPYWIHPALHPEPVEDYLTLKGGKREVELGRFLSPQERRALREVLALSLTRAKTAP